MALLHRWRSYEGSSADEAAELCLLLVRRLVLRRAGQLLIKLEMCCRAWAFLIEDTAAGARLKRKAVNYGKKSAFYL